MPKKKPSNPQPFEDSQKGDVKTEALTLPTKANLIKIDSRASLEIAHSFLRHIKDLKSKIEESFNPQIDKAHALWKSLLAERAKFTDPIDRAVKILRPKMAIFVKEEEARIAEIEARKRNAEQAAKQVAQKAVDKAYKLQEAGQEKKASEAINKGFAKAEEILSEAPQEVPEDIKLEGGSTRTLWKFRIKDESLIPRKYLKPDLTMIGGIVRHMKDQTDIPGIEAYPEETFTQRNIGG